MFICIYRHPSQNKQNFLENLSEILDLEFNFRILSETLL